MTSRVEYQENRSPSWFHSYCPALLHVLTIPYGVVIRSRRKLYERGWLAQRRLPRPVISVGNLTVGGTGKTPVVMWLANWLQAKGKRVGILSRGYRRTNTADCLLVSNGEEILASPEEAGDEPFLMAQNCPGVVIAVGANRYQLGLWVLDKMDLECFILDDGYQHIGLFRDCNFLLIDALDRQGLNALLPAGRLREPLSAAGRATAILVTRADQTSDHPEVIKTMESAIGTSISPFYVQFHPRTVINLRTRHTQPGDWIAGKRAIIFCGIGNAMSFRRTVETMGVTILEEFAFHDHFPYSTTILDRIRAQAQQKKAELVLTTEKDGVKITPLIKENENMWAIQLETKIEKNEEHFLKLLHSVF